MKPWLRLSVFILVGLAVVFGIRLADSRPTPVLAAPLAPTLQERIDDAVDGATLDIEAGTYVENLIIHDKNISLRGADRATTIIQAANSSLRVITADSNKGLRLENLTVTGGHPNTGGGGVYAAGGTLMIVNSRITNNSATYGGGVFLDNADSNLVVSGSVIDLNTAENQGGGAFAAGSATLANATLDSNTAGWHGGGLHVQDGATVLTGGAYSNNHATNGNGGAVNVNNNLSITGSQFSGNTSGDQGGAVTQWNAPWAVTISGATFSNNTAYSMGGGAFISGSLALTNSTFTANTVDSLTSSDDVYGGGLYARGPLSVDGATFTGNQTKCVVPCSFNCGGGIYSVLTTSPVTVTNSTFDGNKGWFGGGLSGTSVYVTHSTFKNASSGGYGGGIGATTVVGDDLLFQDNSVINEGGGVAAVHTTLTHTRFIHNSAQNGGAIRDYNTFSSSNLLFERNVAYGNGAIMFMRANATASLYNATIVQPTQGSGPAIYLEAGAVLNLYNSIVNNYTNAIYLSGSGSTLNEDYNLFYNNGYDVVVGPGSIVNSGGHSTGTQPPGFVDPAAGDYHLIPTSHAIGAGHDYGLTDDLEGRLRLSGRNDVGAYQFWASLFLPYIRK